MDVEDVQNTTNAKFTNKHVEKSSYSRKAP